MVRQNNLAYPTDMVVKLICCLVRQFSLAHGIDPDVNTLEVVNQKLGAQESVPSFLQSRVPVFMWA